MQEIERLANLAVWRGVGFASLGIGVAMLGTVFDLGLSLRLGAALCLALATALYLMAETFHRRDITQTEVWILLRPERRPPIEIARRLIVSAMRLELLRKALYAVRAGCAMLGLAAMIWIGEALEPSGN